MCECHKPCDLEESPIKHRVNKSRTFSVVSSENERLIAEATAPSALLTEEELQDIGDLLSEAADDLVYETENYRLVGEVHASRMLSEIQTLRRLLANAKESLEMIREDAEFSCSKEMNNKMGDNKANPYALNQFMNIRATAEKALSAIPPTV